MQRNYSTQMEAARCGILTPDLETVARKERMRPEDLMPLVAEGKVVTADIGGTAATTEFTQAVIARL